MNFTNNQPIIIGIDHGYGNCKTRNCCFRSGVASYDKEPTFKENLLVYNGRYYLVGEEHKEFLSDKMADNDYYILTLAAIAKELNIRHITSAKVHIAAGLPLTWVSEQKETFRAYLMQNETAEFIFRNISCHIEITGVDIFPQGFSAVADRLREFFCDDAYVNWHCTNEHFNVNEYIRANCEYPGEWTGELERTEKAGDMIVTAAHVYPKDRSWSLHVTSFFKLEDSKIIHAWSMEDAIRYLRTVERL